MFPHQGAEVDDLLSPFQITQGWVCTRGSGKRKERERVQREGVRGQVGGKAGVRQTGESRGDIAVREGSSLFGVLVNLSRTALQPG